MRVWKPDGDHCDTPDPEPGEPVERTAEDAEADARKVMFEHSQIKSRGWQTDRQRAILHRRFDLFVDEYHYLVMCAKVAP